MPIEIRWLEPQKIIHETCVGHISGAEHCSALDTCLHYLDQADAPVNLIVDWRGAEVIPYLAESLPKAVRLRRHLNMGWIVVVPANSALLYREGILAKIVPFRYRFCANCEQAIEFLYSPEAALAVA